jgi:hypothetical protein
MPQKRIKIINKTSRREVQAQPQVKTVPIITKSKLYPVSQKNHIYVW